MSDQTDAAEAWIRRIAGIGKSDDPCAVASEAAGIMRAMLDHPVVGGEVLSAFRALIELCEREMIDPIDVKEIQRAKAVLARIPEDPPWSVAAMRGDSNWAVDE